ncbi:MAG: hypothetical protein GF416_09335 [Candidatus Altiarchaeales archaeon]|nr:hypothetical protein [Candidatus Altiarchaeales archaeon]MBD3417322.1 hypothetical protein [Candidatus Altiarchaeales archaeon]
MKVLNLCDGPGPNPNCPQLIVNDNGSAIIGEDREGIGLCHLNKDQFEKLKEAIKSL